MTDAECMDYVNVSRNTFYKYKNEIKADIEKGLTEAENPTCDGDD